MQAYSNPDRETDPHALPDTEIFFIGTIRHWKDPLNCFQCNDWANDKRTSHSEHIGWYWRSCFPGCLPDSDPMGPFTTEAEALADAQDTD